MSFLAPDGVPGAVGQNSYSVLDGDPRGSHNALYDVSNEFMRVTGYSQQFKRLLSKRANSRPRRQSSVPASYQTVSFDQGGEKLDKDKRSIAGLGSSHELHEHTTFAAAAVALGGRRPPSPPNGIGTINSVIIKRPSSKLTKQRSAYGRLWKEQPNMKHRLRKRKHLFLQRIKVSDFSLLFALAGILLTILEAELASTGTINKVGMLFWSFGAFFKRLIRTHNTD